MMKNIIGWFLRSKPRKKTPIDQMSLSELDKEETAIRQIFPQVEGIKEKQAKASVLLSNLQKYYWNRVLRIRQRRKELERSNGRKEA
jgi:hypothetical protein